MEEILGRDTGSNFKEEEEASNGRNKTKRSIVSKNKSPFDKIRLFFNYVSQFLHKAGTLCGFVTTYDPGLFLTFMSKTQMGLYFLRLLRCGIFPTGQHGKCKGWPD